MTKHFIPKKAINRHKLREMLQLATIILGPAPGPPKSTRFTENQPGFTKNQPGLPKIHQVSPKSTRNAADTDSRGGGGGEGAGENKRHNGRKKMGKHIYFFNREWVKTLLLEEAAASQPGFGKGLRSPSTIFRILVCNHRKLLSFSHTLSAWYA